MMHFNVDFSLSTHTHKYSHSFSINANWKPLAAFQILRSTPSATTNTSTLHTHRIDIWNGKCKTTIALTDAPELRQQRDFPISHQKCSTQKCRATENYRCSTSDGFSMNATFSLGLFGGFSESFAFGTRYIYIYIFRVHGNRFKSFINGLQHVCYWFAWNRGANGSAHAVIGSNNSSSRRKGKKLVRF